MKAKRKKKLFTIGRYLAAAAPRRLALNFRTGQAIFRQGGAADAVYYIRRGTVKLTAVSEAGREAVVGILKAGDLFGEDCLVDKHKHMTTATAMGPTSLLILKREEMIRGLHKEHAFSYRFILHMLKRRARIEEDFVDQLFSSIEKRLASTLLRLANYGKKGRPQKVIPKISEKTLAKMIGTSRGHVNMFMNKFHKFGYIDYDGGIHIDPSLLCVVLID
jgi:CRP/FNR family cyclic AMP-dependent transcriptional regulator